MLVLPVFLVLSTTNFRDNSLSTRFPLSRADFTVFLHELEGLDESKILIDVSSDREIINGNVSDNSMRIDDESASISSTLSITVLNEDTIISANLLGHISQQRNGHVTKSTLFSGLLAPFSMDKLRISRAANNFSVDLAESFSGIVETNDFSRAYEGEVEWVEEQKNPFSLVLFEGNSFNTIIPSSRGESRSLFSNKSAHYCIFISGGCSQTIYLIKKVIAYLNLCPCL